MSAPSLTHLDAAGAANMVDVSEKAVTSRIARAEGRVVMLPETLRLIREGDAKKGDVIGTARLAGIMAAKRTYELIPLCHPLLLSKVSVDAVSIACLTIYDMVKAADRFMRIEGIRLLSKDGGRSGSWQAETAR